MMMEYSVNNTITFEVRETYCWLWDKVIFVGLQQLPSTKIMGQQSQPYRLRENSFDCENH